MTIQIGRLHWFDVSSGEGEVEVAGKIMYMHFSCIVGISKNGYMAPTAEDARILNNLKSGDLCKVTVYKNCYSERVETADFDLQSQ